MSNINNKTGGRVGLIDGSVTAQDAGMYFDDGSKYPGYYFTTGVILFSANGVLTSRIFPGFNAWDKVLLLKTGAGGGVSVDGDPDTTLERRNAGEWTIEAGGVDNTVLDINQNTCKVGIRHNRTVVNADTYNIQQTDYILAVTYTATGTVELTLPAPGSVLAGSTYIVVDEGGLAGTNAITIVPNSGEDVVGGVSFIINNNYNSVALYTDGTDWFAK